MEQQEKNERIMREIEANAEEIGEYCRNIWLDYYKDDYDPEEEVDFSMVTLGADCDNKGNVSWAVQSGDNSYTGAVYSLRHWGVIYPYPATSDEYATDIIDSLEESLPW